MTPSVQSDSETSVCSRSRSPVIDLQTFGSSWFSVVREPRLYLVQLSKYLCSAAPAVVQSRLDSNLLPQHVCSLSAANHRRRTTTGPTETRSGSKLFPVKVTVGKISSAAGRHWPPQQKHEEPRKQTIFRPKRYFQLFSPLELNLEPSTWESETLYHHHRLMLSYSIRLL